MRAVVQRVRSASVQVDGRVVSEIGLGLLVLVGVQRGDAAEDLEYIARKIAGLRVFSDAEGKMNLALAEVGGEVLLVSQFTLLGDVRRGNRPSYTDAEQPVEADERINQLTALLRAAGVSVRTGIFQADMKVGLVNDGPVTILLDSRKQF